MNEPYEQLLERVVLGTAFEPPVRHDGALATEKDVDDGTYWPLHGMSMIGRKRLANIKYCVHKAFSNNVPGDLIETGVWRGGASIYMAGLNSLYADRRRVFVCDSFEGLPTDMSREPDNDPNRQFDYLRPFLQVSLEEVRSNFERLGLLDEHVIFVKGWFIDTLHTLPTDKIAVLRLDGDLYSSTMDTLTALYDKVSPGGFIIVDDYGLAACQQAIDDFRRNRHITDQLIQVDWTGVYWEKSK